MGGVEREWLSGGQEVDGEAAAWPMGTRIHACGRGGRAAPHYPYRTGTGSHDSSSVPATRTPSITSRTGPRLSATRVLMDPTAAGHLWYRYHVMGTLRSDARFGART